MPGVVIAKEFVPSAIPYRANQAHGAKYARGTRPNRKKLDTNRAVPPTARFQPKIPAVSAACCFRDSSGRCDAREKPTAPSGIHRYETSHAVTRAARPMSHADVARMATFRCVRVEPRLPIAMAMSAD